MQYSTRRETLSRNQVAQIIENCAVSDRMSTISGGLHKIKYNNWWFSPLTAPRAGDILSVLFIQER